MWPGPYNGVLLTNSAVKLKEALDESFLGQHTYMGDRLASTGAQRMDRLKSYLSLKVTSIELTDPDQSFIDANLGYNAGVAGHADPETTVRRILQEISKQWEKMEHFGKCSIFSIVWKFLGVFFV